MRLFKIKKGKVITKSSLENIIYVVGSARGGTTLLFKLLGLDRRIYGLPGMSHFYSNAWRGRLCMHKRLFSSVYKGLLPWFDIKKSTRGLDSKEIKSIEQFIDEAVSKKNFKNLYKSYPLISHLSDSLNNNSDISCWTDKSNDWRGLRKIKNEFNKGRFIFIVRDPRSVALSSAQRSIKKEGGDNFLLDYKTIIRQTVSWMWMMDRFVSFYKKNKDISMIVRYEDVVLNPSETLNNIFTFLFNKNTAQADLDAMIASVSGAASNSSEIYKGISKSSLERWKKEFSKKEISVIENLAKNIMKNNLLRYKLSYPTDRVDIINEVGYRFMIATYMKIFLSKILKIFRF